MARKATEEICAYFIAQPNGKLRIAASDLHDRALLARKPSVKVEKIKQWAAAQGLKVEPIGGSEETPPHSYIFEKVES